eukprot:9947563-Alexandrium_andersonii.AAC.1
MPNLLTERAGVRAGCASPGGPGPPAKTSDYDGYCHDANLESMPADIICLALAETCTGKRAAAPRAVFGR